LQGRENDIIILNMVRDFRAQGFSCQRERLCVAFSRARENFICILNKDLMKNHPIFKDMAHRLLPSSAVLDGDAANPFALTKAQFNKL